MKLVARLRTGTPTPAAAAPTPVVRAVPPLTAPAELADWLTEELAQLIYALRQDLAEAAESPACDPDEIARVRDELLGITRRVREIAELLRSERCPELQAERAAGLADRITRDCDAARRLMGRAAALI
jgi:DNA-directed RNA polymerase subunit F